MIIPLFIPHQGCPHRCGYCNEEITVGKCPPRIDDGFFRARVYSFLESRRQNGPVQIAFYGGNFTGLERTYQEELLSMAQPFLDKGLVQGIRISTRPDCIDDEGLNFLKGFSVTTVEIGAQSMVDEVLQKSHRGHSSLEVRRAVGLLKGQGFETGLHLMAGLPGDSPEGFAYSIEETLALRPHTVRIHPTLVLSGTELARAFYNGDYKPLSMPEAVDLCKYALGKFKEAGIPVIRLGLQATQELEKEGSVVAGPFHPAFRSLVEETIFFDMAWKLLSGLPRREGDVKIFLSPRDVSSFRGMKNRNIEAIKKRVPLATLSLFPDAGQERGSVIVEAGGKKWSLRDKEFLSRKMENRKDWKSWNDGIME